MNTMASITTDEHDASQGHNNNKRCRLDASAHDDAPIPKKQRTHSHKRRVQFHVDEQDHIVPHIRIVSRIEADDAPQVWYSHDELNHQRQVDAYWIHCFRDCRCDHNPMMNEYRDDLLQVLGAACGKLSSSTVVLSAQALATSSWRGLEREMSPCFRQRKKQVAANVLQSQAALQAWKSNATNVSKQDAENYTSRLLAAHYHKLAVPAGRFARLLGQGDAAWVMAEEQQAQQQQQQQVVAL